MAPYATEAIILSVRPYRETSALLTIFTKSHGRIQGIAKGIKRKKPMAFFPQRGMIIETTLYLRPHAELGILGSLHLTGFPAADNPDIFTTALLDAGFELLQKFLVLGESHPSLYEQIVLWMWHCVKAPSPLYASIELISFLALCAYHEGYDINTAQCIACSRSLNATDGGTLKTTEGGFVCSYCKPASSTDSFIPLPLIRLIDRTQKNELSLSFGIGQAVSVIRILCSYIAYHASKDDEMKALDFLSSMKLEIV